MNPIVQNLTGMSTLSDQVIATDMLLASKSGIKDLAVAITESATPDVRTVLKSHLDTAITCHEKLTNYMMNKGYYHPYNVNEQLQIDMQSANAALGLQQ
ncbi:spore coat protein [Paenibacillus sp. MER TA 81-3]|uniref:spore coat protein n=1 Tax=Paenibacillus sp. MER TA 81-3 TaxID=2939573 RepID=UPI00203A5035|nr:spore coat protein [Paenibacillus sp. MER TA 81-3]MCM3342658.1 spore coat protein [Paenibacillus sp. MER TA 81-3]